MTKFITWHKVLLRNISSRSVVEWSVTYRSTRIKSLRNNGKTNTLETQLSYFRWAVIHLRQFQGCRGFNKHKKNDFQRERNNHFIYYSANRPDIIRNYVKIRGKIRMIIRMLCLYQYFYVDIWNSDLISGLQGDLQGPN